MYVCVLINAILDRKITDKLEIRTYLGWAIIVLILIMEFFGLINFSLIVILKLINKAKFNKFVKPSSIESP